MPSSADTSVPEPDCSKSEKKAAEDNGFTSEEFTKLQECIPARLYTPSTTAMPDDSAKAIDARRDELKEAFPPQ